jgi:hypothetical protein
MKKVAIPLTLVTIVLGNIITIAMLPESVSAWNGPTHGWICGNEQGFDRSVQKILKWSATNLGLSEKLAWELNATADFLDRQAPWNLKTNSLDPSASESYYWRILADGDEDADLMAYTWDGQPKTYVFSVLGIPDYADSRDLIPLSKYGLITFLSVPLAPFFIIAKTPWATIDQFQNGGSSDVLNISCSNIRTAGEKCSDYFSLALKAADAGNTAQAMWWLGMAVHMIQDCFTPFHSVVSLTWLTTAAGAYNQLCKEADANRNYYILNTDDSINETYQNDKFKQFFNYELQGDPYNWVSVASNFAHTYAEYCDGWSPDDYNTTLTYGLEASQLMTAQFVHYFLSVSGLLKKVASMTVTSPNNNTFWAPGSSQTISWISPTTSVFVAAGYDLGGNGIFHYDGTTWLRACGLVLTYQGGPPRVWGLSDDDVFAPCTQGIARYDGNGWIQPLGAAVVRRGIWASSDDDVFIVGNDMSYHYNGTIYHYDGTATKLMVSSPSEQFMNVWGSFKDDVDDVFVVGDAGSIWHCNRSTCEKMTNPTNPIQGLYGIWGSSKDDVFAVGKSGTILHYDGMSWKNMTSPTGQDLYDIWGACKDDVFAVGKSGTILHYDGMSWKNMTTRPTNGDLYRIWCSSKNDVFVGCNVTNPIAIFHYDGTTWKMTGSWWAEDGEIGGIWGSCGNSVVVELSRDGGSSWTTILDGTANDGSEPWQVTGPTTDHARIRISSGAASAISDEFTIGYPHVSPTTPTAITVTSPNGGEEWQIGTSQAITWEWDGVVRPAVVSIELSRNGADGPWETIVGETNNDGSEPWQVAEPLTNEARIRISGGGASDTSDSNFKITCLQGQFGAYYYDSWFPLYIPDFSGQPTFTRCEDSINCGGSPGDGVNPIHFGVLWEGTCDFDVGNYAFIATAHDGVRVWLDGNLIIDEKRPTNFIVMRTLSAGSHEVRVEYINIWSWPPICQVRWQKQPWPPVTVAHFTW